MKRRDSATREHKNRSVAGSLAQGHSTGSDSIGFVDNRDLSYFYESWGEVRPASTYMEKPVVDSQGLETDTVMASKRAPEVKGAPDFEAIQRRSFEAGKDLLPRDQEQARTDGFEPMGGAFQGVTYQRMSADGYQDWKKTNQARQMHGVASYGDTVVVTRYSKNADVVQLAGFLKKTKGYLVAAEGVLAIAAGIALATAAPVTGGLALVPGIAAIATGVIKVFRGICMIKWGPEEKKTRFDDIEQKEEQELTEEEALKKKQTDARHKKIIDAMRFLESVAAGVGAATTTSVAAAVGLWIFAVAKAVRALIVAYANPDPDADLFLKKVAAALHFIESIAAAAVGAGSIDAGKHVAGVAGVAIGVTKLVRTGDQVAEVGGDSEKDKKLRGETLEPETGRL